MSSSAHSPGRFLASLTPEEIRIAAGRRNGLVLLVTGAIEQHGPHLPVGVDSLLGAWFLNQTLASLEPADPVWVAPPIRIGKSDEHHDFPGSLWLSPQSFRDQILSTVKQLKQWGFNRIAILNTHGGNLPALRTTIREINLGGDFAAMLLESQAETNLGPREILYGIHAGHYETALLLRIAPELVRDHLANCEWMDERIPSGGLAPENSPANFAWKVSDLSSSGTLGDAKRATAAEGELWSNRVVEKIHRQIRELLEPGPDVSR